MEASSGVQVVAPIEPRSSETVAPWWHTVVVLATLATWAYFSALRADHLRTAENVDRIWMYLRTMMFEWGLVAFILLGLSLHKVPFRTVLGERWQSARAFGRDLGLGLLFLVFSIIISTVFISHGHGSNDPAVRFLLPGTAAEKALWILLSLTAGICEEAVNRGYLQRQFGAWTRSAAAGVVLQALVFGACHAYQGFIRAIPITMLGLLLGILTQWRKTVRPGMITHFVQDALAIFVKR